MNNLEFLIELIGENKTENILKSYISTNLGQPIPEKKLGRSSRKIKSDESQPHNKKARVPFTDDDKIIITARAKELYSLSKNWTTVSRTIAHEQNRSLTTIYNFIYRQGLTKELPNVIT